MSWGHNPDITQGFELMIARMLRALTANADAVDVTVERRAAPKVTPPDEAKP
jgi:hypothetical protein